MICGWMCVCLCACGCEVYDARQKIKPRRVHQKIKKKKTRHRIIFYWQYTDRTEKKNTHNNHIECRNRNWTSATFEGGSTRELGEKKNRTRTTCGIIRPLEKYIYLFYERQFEYYSISPVLISHLQMKEWVCLIFHLMSILRIYYASLLSFSTNKAFFTAKWTWIERGSRLNTPKFMRQ